MTLFESPAMPDADPLRFDPDVTRALAFFRAQPSYAVSPLIEVTGPDGLAVLVKDETGRMGLGAFKALGAPYAVACLLAEGWKAETGEVVAPARMAEPEFRAFTARHSFVCASAGNHGMGVAAGAGAMGAQARIYLARTGAGEFCRPAARSGGRGGARRRGL